MKKLNKYDFKVIDEFECNITKRVGIYEDENKNIHVIDEFDCDITKTVSVKRINNEIMFVKRGQTKMKEERLYELAYEALSNKWAREYDFLKEHSEDEISKIRERELWNELIELKEEMKVKGWY